MAIWRRWGVFGRARWVCFAARHEGTQAPRHEGCCADGSEERYRRKGVWAYRRVGVRGTRAFDAFVANSGGANRAKVAGGNICVCGDRAQTIGDFARTGGGEKSAGNWRG